MPDLKDKISRFKQPFKKRFSRNSSREVVQTPASLDPERQALNSSWAPSEAQADEVNARPASTLGDVVRDANTAYKDASHLGGRAAQAVQLTADQWSERVDALFVQISAFSNVIDAIGELHPYASIVTGLIQAGIKPVLKQKARDDAMQKLIEDMTDAFDVVTADDSRLLKDVLDADANLKDDPRCRLLARLAQQTAECAMFIREHYDTKSFLKRALKTIPRPAVDERLRDYSAAFADLGRKIAERDLSDTKDLVTTISIAVSQIDTTLTLQELTYAEGTGRQREKGCLTGTRTETLDSIAKWVVDPDATRALFVVGVAGSGKSSIAHSIASRFEALGHLGAFFAFDRSDPRLRPWSLPSTLARELANWNADFKHELSAVLRDKPSLAKSRDVLEQWQELIVRPARKVIFVGPVLLVIDAFDECTDLQGPASAFNREQQDLERGRSHLLKCLTDRLGELPANFRVVVTSRLEPDVREALVTPTRTGGAGHALYWDTRDLGLSSGEASANIDLYIRDKIKCFLDDGQLNSGQLRSLVEAANGLFEWAAMACRSLVTNDGLTVAERFQNLFEVPPGDLEALYARTLGRLFIADQAQRRFRAVMAQVIYAAEPLSMDTLRALCLAVNDGAVDLILPNLGSVLSGIGDDSTPIRPLHTSFRDFLTRPGPWRVAPGDVHDVMALGALRVLNKSLRFDIWDFPSSYTWNEWFGDIEDTDDRVTKLPAGLVYASLHWNYHLSLASQSAISLQTELRAFLTQKLLFWLEVASLLKFTDRVLSALRTAASFFKPLCDPDINAFIDDAIQFVHNFFVPIEESVPHIYLSALTFCPTTSRIRQSFVRDHGFLPTVDGLAAEWPIELCPHRVFNFAISPDGRHIGLCDTVGDVHVFHTDNMHESLLELAPAPAYVHPVVFSPDGCLIAAASENDYRYVILRWNAQTGETLDISHGHTDWINSICFSPDGRYIVSASDDKTVRRWDAETGQQVDGPLRCHTGSVSSAVCSLNGDIISAGMDATICIWRRGSGQQDAPPLCIPTKDPVVALSRSPRSNLIAVTTQSCDFEITLRVFDFDKRCFVGKSTPTDDPSAFSWSADGQCIGITLKGNIRLWDYSNGSSSIICQCSSLVDIQFSPDEKHIIYSGSDGRLRRVDLPAGQSQRAEYHSGAAEYAAYSSDARFAAVTFCGQTIPHIWDADTGEAVSEVAVSAASRDWLKSSIDAPLVPYNIDDWKERKTRRPHDIVSANGLRSAGVWYNAISVWDAASQTLLRPSIRIPSGDVTCIALSPSGGRVLQGSTDGTVRIFDVEERAGNTPHPATDFSQGQEGSHGTAERHDMTAFHFQGNWLRDKDGHDVIYIPEQYRAHLWVPGLRHILRPNCGPAKPVRIDFTGVGLGEEWTRCAGALNVDIGNTATPASETMVEN